MSKINTSKKQLGQFYTTNYNYILFEINIPESVKKIIEPFCGNGDLVKYMNEHQINCIIECYDIEPKKDFVKIRNTLLDPPNYSDSYIITNPPYLARNKNENKELYNKFGENDLYKCFIRNLIENKCVGGILIVPLNFFCSIRKNDILLRKNFLEVYDILKINIFEERVFEDTSYNVCSFQFSVKNEKKPIMITIFPSKKIFTTSLTEECNYTFGGEIYNLPQSNYKIFRLTKDLDKSLTNNITNILIKCIDDNEYSKISMKIVDNKDIYCDDTLNNSARSYATLVTVPKLDISLQKKLVDKFNEYIEKMRDKYNSLFLANYRDNGRKRISFDLVYDICSYILINL